MANLEDLEKRISQMEQRSKIKDTDKAWETSISRRILLVIFTYLAISIYMNAVGIPDPWVNAIVPSLGFLLSTLSLGFFKGFWAKYIYKKR